MYRVTRCRESYETRAANQRVDHFPVRHLIKIIRLDLFVHCTMFLSPNRAEDTICFSCIFFGSVGGKNELEDGL